MIIASLVRHGKYRLGTTCILKAIFTFPDKVAHDTIMISYTPWYQVQQYLEYRYQYISHEMLLRTRTYRYLVHGTAAARVLLVEQSIAQSKKWASDKPQQQRHAQFPPASTSNRKRKAAAPFDFRPSGEEETTQPIRT